jgi:hypothetical protein
MSYVVLVLYRYGELGDVSCPRSVVVTEQTTDANQGFAFVRFKDRRDLAKAAGDMADKLLTVGEHVLDGEIVPPRHWPNDKTRRYY